MTPPTDRQLTREELAAWLDRPSPEPCVCDDCTPRDERDQVEFALDRPEEAEAEHE